MRSRMLVTFTLGILLVLSACTQDDTSIAAGSSSGGGGEAADPGPASQDPPDDPEPEERQDDELGDIAPEAAPEATEIDIVVLDTPPEGRWEITYSPGTITCPGSVALNFPASDPDFVELAFTNDIYTLTMITAGEDIEMFFVEEMDETFGVSWHWEGVLTVGGVDLLYSLYWDVFGL
ncbi:MAG: hypothetical protein OEV06_11075, partial [Anaerolineae bacterium]|nr:hypothetical protein [Anaerolineae bacterium]